MSSPELGVARVAGAPPLCYKPELQAAVASVAVVSGPSTAAMV
jgi:hypothetical protein